MLKNLVQNLRFKLLMNVLRKVKFYEVARAERVYRSGDLRQMKLDHRPAEASGGRQTLFGVAQNRLHLFTSHAGEPFEEFIHSSPVFQVLEQRLDWHPCALEDPNAADLSRRPFHGGTMTPIKHGEKICK